MTGRFQFDHIPDHASTDLWVEAPGFASVSTGWVATSGASSRFRAGQTDIRVVLQPEAIIRGQVADETGGRGVAGVFLLARDSTRSLAALTEIKDESQAVDVTLAPALVARGRIIDPNGKAIAGAPVSFRASAFSGCRPTIGPRPPRSTVPATLKAEIGTSS